jgi:hypothetical protein
MPVNSLNKFTVPISSGGGLTEQGLLMPRMKYRFRVTFIGFGVSVSTTEMTKQVVDFKRPQINFNTQTIDVYNSKIYLAGKPEWQSVTCTIRDDVGGTVSRLVGEQIQKQFDFLEQASASAGINYKFSIKLEVLDGANGEKITPLETWNLVGCLLDSVDYGDNNYGSNDPMVISLTIRYDNAIQTPSDKSGVGILVPRGTGTAATGQSAPVASPVATVTPA